MKTSGRVCPPLCGKKEISFSHTVIGLIDEYQGRQRQPSPHGVRRMQESAQKLPLTHRRKETRVV